MAANHSTKKDISRFQLHSYAWRNVDIGTDQAIYLLEKTYQSSMAIEVIATNLRHLMIAATDDKDRINFSDVDRMLIAIEQLSSNLSGDTCSYASDIEDKLEKRTAGQS